ncbi:MAG: MBL fold metallo-hydrolase [Actinomycetota bacterium]
MTGRLEAVGQGVLAWLDDEPGPGRPNAGVVVDDDGLTLIDTLMVGSQWEPLADAIEAIERPLRRVVLTSSHIEYVGGTSRFWQAGFYGTRQASAHLDQPPNVDVYRRMFPDLADQFDPELRTHPVTHVVTEDAWLTPAVRAIPTSGQTAENLVVHVPGADVVFGGAMATIGVTPDAFQGDPATWADSLAGIGGLASTIVPGHGPIGSGDDLELLLAYLLACGDAAGAGNDLPPGPWDDWPGAHLHASNIERAAMVARGEDGIPPSVLDRLGLA